MRRLMEVVRAGRVDLTPLLTHNFSLDEIIVRIQGFRRTARWGAKGGGKAVKAVCYDTKAGDSGNLTAKG